MKIQRGEFIPVLVETPVQELREEDLQFLSSGAVGTDLSLALKATLMFAPCCCG